MRTQNMLGKFKKKKFLISNLRQKLTKFSDPKNWKRISTSFPRPKFLILLIVLGL